MEVKMKKNFEEKDAVKMDKDEEKERQLRLSNLYFVFSWSVTSVLKPAKKSKVMSSNRKENALLITNDEVRCGCFLYFPKNINFFILQHKSVKHQAMNTFLKFFKEPEKKRKILEEDIESRMCWYEIRKDPIELMIEGHIIDLESDFRVCLVYSV